MNNQADTPGAVIDTGAPVKQSKKPVLDGMLLQIVGVSYRNTTGKEKPSRPGKSVVGASILRDISFHVEPGECVALTGPSPAAKSILLQLLAGLRAPTDGGVRLDGVDVFSNRRIFNAYIGYVPSVLALHDALTVDEILHDEARLRLPARTPRKVYQQRITELLDLLQLHAVSSTRLRSLSPLHQRLVSIAVELLNRPGLLLVEKNPIETLDDEYQLALLLREVAHAGHTIVQSTESSRAARLADKIIILTGAGEMAWFGPPAEGMTYFRQFSPPGKNNHYPVPGRAPVLVTAADSTSGANVSAPPDGAFGLEDVFSLLAQPGPMTTGINSAWPDLWKSQSAYKTYVDDPLHDKRPDLLLQDRPLSRLRGSTKERQPPPRVHPPSALALLFLLIGRGFRLLTRERSGLLVLLAPPLVALIDFFIASPNMSDPLLGDPGQTPVALGLVVFLNMLVSAILFQREVIKERPVYRSEQRVTPQAVPYILSKAFMVGILAIYQGFVWTAVHMLASGLMGGLAAIPGMWLVFSLTAFLGGLIGLIISTLAHSPQSALVWTLVLLVPTLLFSGSIIPLPNLAAPARALSAVNPARYAFESLLTLSGYGKSVSTDGCWQLPEDQRMALSDAQKQSCACLGQNIFSRCSFPGIHQFFSFVIEQPRPSRPEADTASAGNNATVGSASNSLQQYEDLLSEWQRTRSLVIGGAEGSIGQAVKHYGQAFQVDLARNTWILSLMSLGLLILFAIFQARKGLLE